MRTDSRPSIVSAAAEASQAHPYLSRSARRNVRRAVAQATEMNLHSVKLYGIVWTIRFQAVQQQPKKQERELRPEGSDVRSARRRETSLRRLQDFQRAQRFRISRAFSRWRETNRLSPPPLPPPSLPPPPPPEPQQPPQPSPQQQEQLEIERYAAKRGERSPAAADASPASQEPRAKRPLLPSLPPPPSIPPSPPPSTLSSPPPPPPTTHTSSQTASGQGEVEQSGKVASSDLEYPEYYCELCHRRFYDWIFDPKRILCCACHRDSEFEECMKGQCEYC